MATTLLAHEAFRVQVLLRDEIKKLSFLASVSQILKGKQSNVSEVSELMGDEISRIIAEQRKLEHKYAELVAQRATLTGIHNKAKHTAVAEEIQEVAIGLRENTKNLTRVLKDNPNIQGNLSKIQNDRNQFINYIDGFINDLHNLNTESFNNIILTEVERQNSLSKKRQKEKETALHAKQLQADCVLEKEEYQKEEKEALAQIQNLKESLLEAKTDQSIRLSYEEADFGAAEEKEQRENKTAEKQLEDKIKDLHRRKRLELKVHQKINDFIDLKKQKILTENTEWMNRENEDFTDEDQKLQNLQDKRTAVKARLNALEESVTREELRQKEREEEEQRMSEIMRLKAIENERKALALKVILAEYMEFREKFATMKKKKGRRGGKKGKKGKKK